jgi:tRNA modification GTPase
MADVPGSGSTADDGVVTAGSGQPSACRADGPLVSVLTPNGRGAIAVVRVSGPGSVGLADAVFRPYRGPGLARSAPGRIRIGRVGRGLGDEVVAIVLDERVDCVELQCHGGSAAVEMVIDSLELAGAKRAAPTLLVATSTDGSIAAEAMIDLCQAPTIQTAEILLEQAEGALGRELTGLISLIDRDWPLAAALLRVDELIDRATVGLRLLTGWKVVIAGRPNVGKSRLLNALAGFTRAIVDPMPGTTRDVVTLSTALEGWPVELADTAGLRDAADPIEAEGIARSRREQSAADLILLVLDRSEALRPIDLEMEKSCRHAVVVANKSDLPAAWETGDLRAAQKPAVTVSAECGDGIVDLCAAIVRNLVPSAPKPEDAVPFRPRHVQALNRARECLTKGDRPTAKTLLESLARGD